MEVLISICGVELFSHLKCCFVLCSSSCASSLHCLGAMDPWGVLEHPWGALEHHWASQYVLLTMCVCVCVCVCRGHDFSLCSWREVCSLWKV